MLKNTFFTTPLATNSPKQQQQQQSAKFKVHQDSPITISSRSSTPSSSSSSSGSESDEEENARSSPDSIKTELMLFKPISREPRTISAPAKLIRVPSIRSTSSASSVIHSPCPSPFSIPLTPCRQSAFSFVKVQLLPPKTNKRKVSKSSPEKKSEGSSPKRQKRGKKIVETVEVAPKRCTRKSEILAPVNLKKTEIIRETRSKRYSETIVTNPVKEFKSPQKKQGKRNSTVVKLTASSLGDRRITRSMKN